MEMNDKNIKLRCEGWSFDGMILNEIYKEFERLKSEYKDIFDKVKQINGGELKIYQINGLTDFFVGNIILNGPSKTYTGEELFKMLSDILSRTTSISTFRASYDGYCTPENKVKITRLGITINIDNFNQYIVRELDSVDVLIKEFKLDLRHEIGHIIDFLSYDGMDADEYERMNETNVNAEKEFYENLKTNPITNTKDFDTMYHMLPREAVADRNAGITIKDFHDIDEAKNSDKSYGNMITTFDINVSYEKFNNKKNNKDGINEN